MRAFALSGDAALRAGLRSLWFTIVPAFLAGLAVGFLVPSAPSGAVGIGAAVGSLGRRYPILLGAALFLLFASLARYWRFHLPGGSFTSSPRASPVAGTPRGRLRESIGLAVAVSLAAGAALAFRAWVADSYTVLGGSMLPTLAPGDAIEGTRFASGSPRRGDIIVFPWASAPSLEGPEAARLVKRVIGLPGDRIAMSGGVPVINGWHVPTCNVGEYLFVAPDAEGTALRARLFVEFLGDQAYLTLKAAGPRDFPGTYEVKPGEVFVLGDNRNTSVDSRSWNDGAGGGVPLVSIVARARWFLSGNHLDGRADLGRLLRPLGGPAPRLHVEGIDARPLGQGIEQCLKERPRETHPPRPADGPTAGP